MINRDELEKLIDTIIDAMVELGEAEDKLTSARVKIEGVSNTLYRRWNPK